MPTYFKPLRRKVGVFTLALACLFAAVWIRGMIQPFRLIIPGGRYIEYVVYADSQKLHLSKEEQIWVGVRVTPNLTLAKISLPHWSIVTPLTLLSAWLLLSRPRVKNRRDVIAAEKIPESGGTGGWPE